VGQLSSPAGLSPEQVVDALMCAAQLAAIVMVRIMRFG
jgi:hypothetical protein